MVYKPFWRVMVFEDLVWVMRSFRAVYLVLVFELIFQVGVLIVCVIAVLLDDLDWVWRF